MVSKGEGRQWVGSFQVLSLQQFGERKRACSRSSRKYVACCLSPSWSAPYWLELLRTPDCRREALGSERQPRHPTSLPRLAHGLLSLLTSLPFPLEDRCPLLFQLGALMSLRLKEPRKRKAAQGRTEGSERKCVEKELGRCQVSGPSLLGRLSKLRA